VLIFEKKFLHDKINLLSLFMYQGSNALFPVVAFPFLLHVLGVVKYRHIAIAEAVALFVVSAVLYGFDVTGVTRILQPTNKQEKDAVSTVFFGVLFARLMIFFLCLSLLILSSVVVNKQQVMLICIWLMVPLGYILQSSYFFVATENNLVPALITLVVKLFFLGVLFIYVNKESTACFVSIIIGLSYVVAGLVSLLYIIFRYDVKKACYGGSYCLKYLKEDAPVFYGNISVVFYKEFNLLMLGFMHVSSIAIATYSIASKIITCFQASIRPLNQYFYPKIINRLGSVNYNVGRVFKLALAKTTVQIIIILVIGLCALVLLKLNYALVAALLHNIDLGSLLLNIYIMFFATVFGAANFMFGSCGLNALVYKKAYAKILISIAVVNVLTGFLLVHFFGAYGAPVNFLLAEVFLAGCIFFVYIKDWDVSRAYEVAVG
jgi:PST family polysaccharide transporter